MGSSVGAKKKKEEEKNEDINANDKTKKLVPRDIFQENESQKDKKTSQSKLLNTKSDKLTNPIINKNNLQPGLDISLSRQNQISQIENDKMSLPKKNFMSNQILPNDVKLETNDDKKDKDKDKDKNDKNKKDKDKKDKDPKKKDDDDNDNPFWDYDDDDEEFEEEDPWKDFNPKKPTKKDEKKDKEEKDEIKEKDEKKINENKNEGGVYKLLTWILIFALCIICVILFFILKKFKILNRKNINYQQLMGVEFNNI